MRKIMALCGTMALVSGVAFAQGFMPWTDVMLMADNDGSGSLSMEEVKKFNAKDHIVGFQPFMIDHFKDCDASADGTISMVELKKCTKAMGMTDTETSEVFYKGLGFMPRAAQ